MLINWFTVIAQAVNFLILVWLLKRFLYKPILHAIDEREKGIATQLAQADAKVAEAQKEREDFQHKNEAFDHERAALLTKTADEAKAERERILALAQKDADSLRAKRHDALRIEQRNLNQEIMRWTQREVFAITRKTLADLATTGLEEQISAVFVGRLRGLEGETKDQLAAALKTSPCTALLRSAFDLPAAQRASIESAVNETFDAKAKVEFQTAPMRVSGVELSANGQKVAWSIADYLATLEKSAGELLHEDAKTESEPDGKSQSERAAEAKRRPKAETQPVLKDGAEPEAMREHKNGPAPVAAATKADH
jgi:F-type H+-transporting ATPase subunit b